MESDWSLLPGVGLGRLKFGMSPEAYSDFEGIYGKVKIDYRPKHPSEREEKAWQDTIKTLEPTVRLEYIERRKNLIDFRSKKNTHHTEGNLEFSYYEKKLYEIGADKYCEKLHLNGLPVFLSDPEEVVLEFARTLNENPLVNGTDTVFRESHVYLFGFTKGLNWRGKLSYYSLADAEDDPDADTEAQQRSLSWGTRPRNVNPEDWSQHVLVPLIQP